MEMTRIFTRMAFAAIAILAFLSPFAAKASGEEPAKAAVPVNAGPVANAAQSKGGQSQASQSKGNKTQKGSTANRKKSTKNDTMSQEGQKFSLNPDFAFPKDVMRNAEEELSRAIAKGDDERGLLAAMQIFASSQQINSDSLDKDLKRFDQIVSRLKPFYRSLGKLMEASYLSSNYERSQWEISNRKVAGAPEEMEIGLWGTDQYADAILSIVEESFSLMPRKEMNDPWKKVYFCLNQSDKKYGEMLTVNQFMQLAAMQYLSRFSDSRSSERILPLSTVGTDNKISKAITSQEKAAEYCQQLKDSYISGLTSDSSQLAWGEGVDMVTSSFYNEDALYASLSRLEDMMKRTEGSENQVPVLNALLNLLRRSTPASRKPASSAGTDPQKEDGEEKLRDCIYKAENLLAKYPKSLYSNNLKGTVHDMTQPSMDANLREQYLPGIEGQQLTLEMTNLNSAYLLIVKDLRSNRKGAPTLRQMRVNGQIVASLPVEAKGAIPFTSNVEMTLPALTPGQYALIPSRTNKLSGAIPGEREDLRRIIVSEFGALSVRTPSSNSVYAVNAGTGSPIDGVSMNFLRSDWKGDKNYGTLTTDSIGMVLLPEEWKDANQLKMQKGRDFRQYPIYPNYGRNQDNRENTYLTLLPSRAILRPGDEMQFAGIAYSIRDKEINLLSDESFAIELIEPFRNTVDSLLVKTDEMGRFEGKFIIPEGRPLGYWSLSGRHLSIKSSGVNGSCTFRVEEYSNPTFRLILDKPEMLSDSIIRLSGRAETFSGMGVAGAKVDMDIATRTPRWWFFSQPTATFHCQTMTGADGRFSLELNTSGLKGSEYQKTALTLSASAVSPGGETQRDDVNFSIGEGLVLVPDLPGLIEGNVSELTLGVRAFNMQDEPQSVEARYSLTEKETGRVAADGNFTTPLLKLDPRRLPSAEYTLAVWFDNDESSRREASFSLWRRTDTRPSGEVPLWVPETKITASENQKDVEVIVGSSFKDQRILCVVDDTKSVIEQRWLEPAGENLKLSFPVPEDGERLFVTFTTFHDLRPYSTTVTIAPASADRRLEVEKVSFRDRLTAGEKETWEFRFRFNNGENAGKVAAMGVMTDLALDRLVPFVWNFSPRDGISYQPCSSIRAERIGDSYIYSDFSAPWKYPTQFNFNLPSWRYGILRAFYKYEGYRESAMVCCDMDAAVPSPGSVSNSVSTKVMVRGSKKMALADGAVTAEESSLEYDDDYADAGAGEIGGTKGDADSAVYRESELPVAFFKPMLTADADGNLVVSYEVPNFNTTWKFQLLGYDRRLYTAKTTLEALSAKEVMVSGAMPRFLRTGDKARLTANLFNNSLREQKIGGRIEILNLSTGKPITSKTYKEVAVAPGESRLIDIQFEVPADVTSLLVRSYASGGGHSDGEQEMVPVLPSSSPVVESQPFYLAPNEREFEMRLPKMDKGSSVTLMYCDNPSWYALTALPALVSNPNTTSSLSLLRAYYGNSIGLGLISNNPALRKGLAEIVEKEKTTMLASNLELNQSLKTVALQSTPWLLDARSETQRMLSLGELLDDTNGKKVLDELFGNLKKFQNTDGGLSWCTDAPSSSWVSGQTLLYLSMLGKFGYLPESDEMEQFILNLDGYNMNNLVSRWKERQKVGKMTREDEEKVLASMLLNYLYVRSNFGKDSGSLTKESSIFKSMEEKALRGVISTWRNLSVYEKATAATLLWRSGKQDEAKEILRSLAQFATVSKTKGTWFANLERNPWSPWNPLITTAQVLEAWVEIDPSASEVDGLRQWMLLQRQSQDWSLESYGAELVAALLTGGAAWTDGGNGKVKITVDGRNILKDNMIPSYGEAVIDLTASKVSGAKLKISREAASPAWGGVMEQYIAPISDIRPSSIDDLSIEKSLTVMRQQDGREVAVTLDQAGELRVGDKVMVQLSVICGRDMEYVVLTDERGATLEPTQPLSSADVIDSVWLYREVRDTQTNLFIPYLRKGKFQISYECRLSMAGDYSAGIATVQSQYAPSLTAHSAGLEISVKE